MAKISFKNPFRPGAGHMPPHLAGRSKETREFHKLLQQEVILENLVLTGLRGVGKTVLLDTFKPLALKEKWMWAGTDLSESVSISEEATVMRLLTDLSVVTSNTVFESGKISSMGFNIKEEVVQENLNYTTLVNIFEAIPGLLSDKLKGVLEFVWSCIRDKEAKGIIFAYDEAQTMSDHAQKGQYPLSLILDVFQSLQRKSIRFMLVLTGLPTLFPKLVEARTFSERMFRVMFLDRLGRRDCEEAILVPIRKASCLVKFSEPAIDAIIEKSGGYPYFIQFICKESFDMYLQQLSISSEGYIDYKKAIDDITRKLDNDFFAGRWAKATDRQRELLYAIANLPNCDDEFTVQEVVEEAQKSEKPFSSSHVNQMLSTLTNMGLVYKNRHGKYSFAVPLLGQYILRQQSKFEKKQGNYLFDI